MASLAGGEEEHLGLDIGRLPTFGRGVPEGGGLGLVEVDGDHPIELGDAHLLPKLRIGFLVAPESLMPGLRTAKARLDWFSAPEPQRALSEFLRYGLFARHLRRLTRILRRRTPADQPCVLLGDLNLPGPVARWSTGWRSLARVKTFPAPNPSLQIDHVLADGRVPAARAAWARALPVSDHRALVVDLADG